MVTIWLELARLRAGLCNLFVWRATRAIFKVVAGRIIKINKTQKTTAVTVPFYAEQVIS